MTRNGSGSPVEARPERLRAGQMDVCHSERLREPRRSETDLRSSECAYLEWPGTAPGDPVEARLAVLLPVMLRTLLEAAPGARWK